MIRRPRHSCRPEVARLEVRDVPTVVSPLAFGGAGLAAQRANAVANAALYGHATPAASTNNTGTPNGINFNPNPTLDLSQLTPYGRAASRFNILVDGPYGVARSLYIDASRQLIFIGNIRGESNQILHGTMIMRIVIPTDPTATVYGIAVLRDLSNASTGNQAVLDLTNTAKDALGRPTQFTWTLDATSGGSYINAPGQGTLSITYKAHATTAHGGSPNAAGGAISVFKGNVLPDPAQLNVLYDIPRFG